MSKLSNLKRPTAPQVYRPQPVPKVLQTKSATAQPQAIVQSRKIATGLPINQARQPVAPPVSRPQPVPRVLQKKSSLAQSPKAGEAPRQPIAPPVYRPEARKIVQLKSAASIPAGKWLSHYEVHFRWTVTRRDPEGNGESWTSPEMVHTVDCAYNDGEPVKITHNAAGNIDWIVELT